VKRRFSFKGLEVDYTSNKFQAAARNSLVKAYAERGREGERERETIERKRKEREREKEQLRSKCILPWVRFSHTFLSLSLSLFISLLIFSFPS
jgi:hypothetical protein